MAELVGSKRTIWMRDVKVFLINKSKLNDNGSYDTFVFGDDYSFKIEITGHKYLSALKDEFVVTIYNLDYATIATLISQGYRDIEIYCGYKSIGNVKRIFKGGIFMISNQRDDVKTNRCVIVCTSVLVARFMGSRLNLSVRGSTNIYDMLNYINKVSGINNAIIPETLRGKTIEQFIAEDRGKAYVNNQGNSLDYSTQGNTGNVFMSLIDSTDSLGISADSSDGSTISVFDLKNINGPAIEVTAEQGMIIDGFPTINNEGIVFNSLCNYHFKPGDLIHIDNSQLQYSFGSKDAALESPILTQGIDADGYYIVFQIDYSISNMGGSFKQTLTCKSRQLLMNLQEVETDV